MKVILATCLAMGIKLHATDDDDGFLGIQELAEQMQNTKTDEAEAKVDAIREEAVDSAVKEAEKPDKTAAPGSQPAEATGDTPFPGYRPVKQILGDTDPSMYVKDLMSSKPDEHLYHLMLSDSDSLLKSIEHDFPELAKVHVIGKTVKGRDMNVLEINLEATPSDSTLLQGDDLLMDAAEGVFGDEDDKPKKIDTGKLGH